jgi:membrane-associated protein
MTYRKFIGFCLAGGALWVTGLTLLGYIFGSTRIVKENFELVVLGIIGVSVLPIFIELIRSRLNKGKEAE